MDFYESSNVGRGMAEICYFWFVFFVYYGFTIIEDVNNSF